MVIWGAIIKAETLDAEGAHILDVVRPKNRSAWCSRPSISSFTGRGPLPSLDVST